MGKTVVTTQEDFNVDGNAILIQNLDVEQVYDPQNSNESGYDSGNASYDLRVGGKYRDHRDSGSTDLVEKDSIRLPPGAAVIIETEERLYFPRSRFGHIVPKVGLLQRGISNTSSKVDPGYNGKLLITVFNLGKKEVHLEKGQKFCTLYAIDVLTNVGEVRLYNKTPKSIPSGSRKNWWRVIADFLKEYNAPLALIISLIAIIVSFLNPVFSALSFFFK